MDPRLVALVKALRDAACFIESPETVKHLPDLKEDRHPLHLPRLIAAVALAWTARQLRAIALLLENDAALESEPIIRALLEHAITVAWVGGDVERAECYRDTGLTSMNTWVTAMCKVLPGYFTARALAEVNAALAKGTGQSMPRFGDRVQEAEERGGMPGLLQRAYDFSYRRLSASVHGDSRLFDLVVGQPGVLPMLDARDTAIAAAIMLTSAGTTLGISTLAGQAARELLRAVDASGAPRREQHG